MKTKKHDTRWMVSVALMAAIVIVLANTPLGMIQLPIIKATTVHIPVILGAILLGPGAGAILGAVFGICSLVSNTMAPTLLSFAFSPFLSTTGIPGALKAIWISVGCRILIGVVAGWLWVLFTKIKLNQFIALPIVGFVGSMVNTVTVMGSIYFLFAQQYAESDLANRKLAGSLSMRPIRKNASFVDNKKVTDHHAIIPTEQFVDLQTMTNEERKVYDLVVRRFLAVLLPAFEYDQTVFTGGLAGESFTAKGKIVKSQGWKEAYENLETDEEWEEADDLAAAPKEQTLPSVKKGDSMPVAKVTVTTGKTTPPAYFTEATLLSAMENPVRYMESKDAKAAKTLGETGGLGTVATRADIIDKLFNSFLMEKKGNEIHVTGKGKQLLELVPSELKKPELTAAWEMKLSGIAKGNLQEKAFIEEISDYTEELIREIKAGTQTFRHDNLTNKKCPQCGKRLLAVNGKNSKMLVCQDRECGYRETLSSLVV